MNQPLVHLIDLNSVGVVRILPVFYRNRFYSGYRSLDPISLLNLSALETCSISQS